MEHATYARKVSRLLDVRPLPERFERPADFDLAVFWRAWCAEFEANRPSYPIQARVAPHLVPKLLRLTLIDYARQILGRYGV